MCTRLAYLAIVAARTGKTPRDLARAAIDRILAKAGYSRRERRRLIRDLASGHAGEAERPKP